MAAKEERLFMRKIGPRDGGDLPKLTGQARNNEIIQIFRVAEIFESVKAQITNFESGAKGAVLDFVVHRA